MEDHRVDRHRSTVLTKAVIRAADGLRLSHTELASVISISVDTVRRMHSESHVLDENSKAWELAGLLVQLYCGLDAITAGDTSSAQAWMRNQNKDLHDVPIKLIRHVAGLVRTVTYVGAKRSRI